MRRPYVRQINHIRDFIRMIYVHSTPGRLRIRIPELRGLREETDRACDRLLAVEGILSVKANHLTGSLLILYDRARMSAEAVWAALLRFGYVRRQPPPAVTGREAESYSAHWTSKATGAVVEAVVQKVAEASLMMLVRALI